ncbi:helix-turn-helix domain-containing protein [Paenibacillus sp. MWE-103]|uniref:Helix-turn-helix domain-containing protein n=1 Tax=Paenibacillus artemisiicola TaxID=1172618 RepID=A0ABS3WL42_9BACL|nr:AraC family transcriptional regulator [Paenibacillus artemisiicola]MBO7749049.1 helix-turn-helix domain-containing protein [Paenibacillus artemisiicola]
MYLWNETDIWLNQFALRPRTDDAVFTVHYWGVSEHLMSNFLHKHSFFEICYVLGGRGTYLDDGTLYPLSKGTLFCSRPGITHYIECEPELAILFVAFELEESESSESARSAFQALAAAETVVVQDGDELAAAQLWRALLRRSGERASLPESVLTPLAASLLQSLPSVFAKPAQPERTAPRRSASALLKQAKLFITDNLSDEDLSLEKVAAQVSISPRHLSRLFASGVHESYTLYVRKQRIRRAAELLRYTDRSIKEIAEATGFGSVHYFTRTFSDLMNVPPGRFREDARLHD